MYLFKHFKIRTYEIGLVFRDGEFRGLLEAGSHWRFDPLNKLRVQICSLRQPWLVHEQLDVIARSGVLKDRAMVLDLKDYERALVWIDGRFSHILPPGLYAYWLSEKDVRVEIADARPVRFNHSELPVILRSPLADRALESVVIEAGFEGVVYFDGKYVETIGAGQYAFWKNVARVLVQRVDRRESVIEVGGQEIMTADKVTLRLNALAAYRVIDARKATLTTDDVRQALYRDVQLALRAVIGARELDSLLADKDAVAGEIETAVRRRASELGLEIVSVGIRDVILPGDMKDLMNKVMEARKAAEANLISRREETAAARSQANTAKVLAENPTLMRLRELEVLEKIAAGGKLQIVAGEKGLAERVVNLL
jgi:regulator of protease activity HflC (stomatin/prohibitin superfamily)